MDAGRHPLIDVVTMAEVVGCEGEPGDFRVRVRRAPRYVREDRCVACGLCVDACPQVGGNEFDVGLKARKAIFRPFPQSVPAAYAIDAESCLSWQGLRCEVCYRVCPVKGAAITIQNHPRQTSKHALFVPMVHSEACTGCGMCEDACPTEVAAIRVINPKLVQGRIGSHYRLGWKSDTPITQDFNPADVPAGAPAQQSAPAERAAPKSAPGMDVLNEGLEP
jgi:heterodisulfide reductase subunit A-like polyferredoxin